MARERRVRGENHPDTLTLARNLAVDLRRLGEYQAARELDEDTLARRRVLGGEDHPDTLLSARSLAAHAVPAVSGSPSATASTIGRSVGNRSPVEIPRIVC